MLHKNTETYQPWLQRSVCWHTSAWKEFHNLGFLLQWEKWSTIGKHLWQLSVIFWNRCYFEVILWETKKNTKNPQAKTLQASQSTYVTAELGLNQLVSEGCHEKAASVYKGHQLESIKALRNKETNCWNKIPRRGSVWSWTPLRRRWKAKLRSFMNYTSHLHSASCRGGPKGLLQHQTATSMQEKVQTFLPLEQHYTHWSQPHTNESFYTKAKTKKWTLKVMHCNLFSFILWSQFQLKFVYCTFQSFMTRADFIFSFQFFYSFVFHFYPSHFI